MLLPNALRVHDDMPLRLERATTASTPRPADPAPANDWNHATPADKPPKRVRLQLTEAAEAEAHDFQRLYGSGNCSCHISPPCGSCTHPGNPMNLEEDDDAWMMGHAEEVAACS